MAAWWDPKLRPFSRVRYVVTETLPRTQPGLSSQRSHVATEGLKLALAKYGFDGLIAGIRRDKDRSRWSAAKRRPRIRRAGSLDVLR
jgi:3'-phosphoadenosine 5'-phosphosulfate sulfotransferase (PAPS reductase)/FAD synthetase